MQALAALSHLACRFPPDKVSNFVESSLSLIRDPICPVQIRSSVAESLAFNLGVRSFTYSSDFDADHFLKLQSDSQRIIVPTLKILSDLGDLSSRKGDVRLVKSSIVALAKFYSAWHKYESDDVYGKEALSFDNIDFLGRRQNGAEADQYKDKDTLDFRRLSAETSFLRAVFDRLNELVSGMHVYKC